jgi:hypothetical protein
VRKIILSLSIFLVVAVLSMSFSTIASAEDVRYPDEPTAIGMLADFVVVRPFAILGAGISTVGYGLSYPFSYWARNTEQAKQKMVVEPFEYAFKRPLGDF